MAVMMVADLVGVWDALLAVLMVVMTGVETVD